MRFKLIVYPDGRSLLATESEITRDELERMGEVLRQWATDKTMALLASTTVIMATEFEMEAWHGERTDAAE